MRSRYLKATLTAGCLSLLLAAGVEAQGVTLEEQSQWGPALAYLNNNIFLGWTGRDGKINIMRSAEGVDWRAKITMEEKSERPPTLARVGLHQGPVGMNGAQDRRCPSASCSW